MRLMQELKFGGGAAWGACLSYSVFPMGSFLSAEAVCDSAGGVVVLTLAAGEGRDEDAFGVWLGGTDEVWTAGAGDGAGAA